MNTARPRNNMVYLLIIVAIGAIIFTALRSNSVQSEDVPLSEVATLVNQNKVKEITVSGDDIKVDTGGQVITSRKDPTIDLPAQLAVFLEDLVSVDRPPEWGTLLSTLSFLLPGLIVVGLIYFMFR